MPESSLPHLDWKAGAGTHDQRESSYTVVLFLDFGLGKAGYVRGSNGWVSLLQPQLEIGARVRRFRWKIHYIQGWGPPAQFVVSARCLVNVNW